MTNNILNKDITGIDCSIKYFFPFFYRGGFSSALENRWTKTEGMEAFVEKDTLSMLSESIFKKSAHEAPMVTYKFNPKNSGFEYEKLKNMILKTDELAIPFIISNLQMHVFMNGVSILTFDAAIKNSLELILFSNNAVKANADTIWVSTSFSEKGIECADRSNPEIEKNFSVKSIQDKSKYNIEYFIGRKNAGFIIDEHAGIITKIRLILSAEKDAGAYAETLLFFNKYFRMGNNKKASSDLVYYDRAGNSDHTTTVNSIISGIISSFKPEHYKDSYFDYGFFRFFYVGFYGIRNWNIFEQRTSRFIYLLKNMQLSGDNSKIDFSISEACLRLNENTVLLASLKGGGAFSFYESDSKKRSPKNFISAHYYGILFPLYQRVTLIDFSHRLSNTFSIEHIYFNKKTKSNRLAEFEDLLEEFGAFSTKCWFPELSDNEVRNTAYKKWQEIFGVVSLFENVRNQLHDIVDYFNVKDLKNDERNQKLQNTLIFILTLIFIPLNFFVGFMGMNIKIFTGSGLSVVNTFLLGILITVICSVIIVAVYRLVSSRYRDS